MGSFRYHEVGLQQERPDYRGALELPAAQLARTAPVEVLAGASPASSSASTTLRRASASEAARPWTRRGSASCSPRGKRGVKAGIGVLGMSCILLRSGLSPPSSMWVMSVSSNSILPPVGSRRRRSSLPSVDLPEPLSPTSAASSPLPASSQASSTAARPPGACSSRRCPPLRSAPAYSSRRRLHPGLPGGTLHLPPVLAASPSPSPMRARLSASSVIAAPGAAMSHGYWRARPFAL